MSSPRRSALFCSAVCLAFMGCRGGPQVIGPSGQSSTNIIEERALCSVTMTITDPVALTGVAQFQARTVSSSGLGNAGPLTGVAFAEVEVLDASDNVIQCGSTDASGNLVAIDLVSPLRINKTTGRFSVRVNSRAFNSKIKTSIVSTPLLNTLYSLTGSFSLQGIETTKAVAISSASILGTLEGGAFNILYQIYLANEYLRNNASACLPSDGGSCTAFTVAPKIKVFWSPGVDPGTAYLGLSYPISAYLRATDPAYKGLYILGGKSGDFDCTDTDHFDNSVVLHEYAHFLEEYFSRTDSPGGSHSGNSVIDPRLAWSEGWANFFQGAVTGLPIYQDSIRNSSCASGTALQISLDLDTQVVGASACPMGSSTPTINYSMDVPGSSEEGTFREVSVSRTLFQLNAATSTSGAAKDTNFGFNFIWRAFNDASVGLARVSTSFRSSGFFNSSLNTILAANPTVATTNFNSVMTYEKQSKNAGTYFYGQPITAKACAALPFSMTGGKYSRQKQVGTFGVPSTTTVTNCNSTITYTPSLQKNNQFLRFDWGGGNFSVVLHYLSAGGADLDLYVYSESHSLFDTSSMVGYSALTRAAETMRGGYQSELVSIPGLAAGTYMIHVSMDDSVQLYYDGISATYDLTLGSGATLCP